MKIIKLNACIQGIDITEYFLWEYNTLVLNRFHSVKSYENSITYVAF
jgi:hypothetical protein